MLVLAGEGIAELLAMLTWVLFGAIMVGQFWSAMTWDVLIYSLLSLTVIRMVPMLLALIGTGEILETRLFLAWFGPRGLASILFVLLVLEEAEVANRDILLSITMITVALSTLLHGVTAAPLARRYGHMAASMGVCEENQPASELPLRAGPMPTGKD